MRKGIAALLFSFAALSSSPAKAVDFGCSDGICCLSGSAGSICCHFVDGMYCSVIITGG